MLSPAPNAMVSIHVATPVHSAKRTAAEIYRARLPSVGHLQQQQQRQQLDTKLRERWLEPSKQPNYTFLVQHATPRGPYALTKHCLQTPSIRPPNNECPTQKETNCYKRPWVAQSPPPLPAAPLSKSCSGPVQAIPAEQAPPTCAAFTSPALYRTSTPLKSYKGKARAKW